MIVILISHCLESEYGVKTRVIDVDFTGGREIYDRIGPQLQDLDIGVLINNVGMSYNFPEFFNAMPDGPELCTRLMHCNILSVTGMTLLVMPKMAEKRRGLILNVSSATAVLPSPLLSMYGSTKVRNSNIPIATLSTAVKIEIYPSSQFSPGIFKAGLSLANSNIIHRVP